MDSALESITTLRSGQLAASVQTSRGARLVDSYLEAKLALREALVGPEQGWIAAVRDTLAGKSVDPEIDLSHDDGWAAWALDNVIAPRGLARERLGLADARVEADATAARAVIACGRVCLAAGRPAGSPTSRGRPGALEDALSSALARWIDVEESQNLDITTEASGESPSRRGTTLAASAVSDAISSHVSERGSCAGTDLSGLLDRLVAGCPGLPTRQVRDLVLHLGASAPRILDGDVARILLVGGPDRELVSGEEAPVDSGFAALFEIEAMAGAAGAAYPDPLRTAFFRWDRDWLGAVGTAAIYVAGALGGAPSDVRWAVTAGGDCLVDRAVCGASAGGAIGLALLRLWSRLLARDAVGA